MLNSVFLETYSALIILINLITGFLLSEKSLVFSRLNPSGVILIFTGLFLLFDRLNIDYSSKVKNKLLPLSIIFIFLSYSGICYTTVYKFIKARFFSYLFFCFSFLTLTWIVLGENIEDIKNQYLVVAALGIIFSVLYLIPEYRKKGDIFNISTSILTFCLTVFIFTCVKTPLNLKKESNKNVVQTRNDKRL